ncbi:hypothetical protein DL98DRAFT_656201 [Cadophora sp. DSE1049]|nr:hypothetical protein DL98DRAFT_656201 [Cadophora sp. DSE1049]
MRPATISGGVREGIECSTTHDSAMEDNDGQKSSNGSRDLPTDVPSQSTSFNPSRSHDPPQPSSFGLRHDLLPGGANVNMPDTYARIQAYKPPAYVSPYGPATKAKPAAASDKSSDLPTVVSKPRRLSSRDDPPWLCCFAQKRVPEWSRHPEIWNPGATTVCTASVPQPCQHKKCENCLWESSEEPPEDATNPKLQISEARKPVVMTDASELDDDLEGGPIREDLADEVSQEDMIHLENSFEMTPTSMLVPKATNYDPETGRLRLWPKD